MPQIDDFEGTSTYVGPDGAEAAAPPVVEAPASAEASTETPAEAARARNTDGTFKKADEAADGEPKADEFEEVEAKKEPEPQAEKPRKPRDDPKARVEQATAREAAAKREAAEWRRRAEAAEAAVKTPEPKPAAQHAKAPVDDDPEPNPADYEHGEFDPKYLREVAKHEGRRASREEIQRHRQATDTQREEQRVDRVRGERHEAWRTRIAAAIERDPSLDVQVSGDVVAALEAAQSRRNGQPVSKLAAIGDVLLDSDVSHALMRHLSEHPDDFQRLSTLHPIQIVRELGRLEARMDAASPPGTAPRAPQLSQAKPPVRPVTGAPSTSDEDPDAIDDFDRFKAVNDRRDRERRRA
jgi:hypothetical protein